MVGIIWREGGILLVDLSGDSKERGILRQASQHTGMVSSQVSGWTILTPSGVPDVTRWTVLGAKGMKKHLVGGGEMQTTATPWV